ncbi:Bax inhibitor-1/YccA family protein [Actinoallomurus spadix]|uniref:Bax inhibitor-1/YccA family protein n=1 Tax=Actinoallomurus spadix TaxID=79912 RepID=A0ABP3GXG3_9ACTN|nr:Bax inhibitor-1/YccA family protein [Actinoallomurus spadix]MCO5986913.1 Bax inhibitor-1/YccA family protein [Actinoallomurus spadix]
MESRNPVLSRRGAFGQQSSGYAPSVYQLEAMYNTSSYAPPRSMTIDDVVVRSLLTLGTLAVAGAAAWILVPDRLANAVALAGVVVGLICWAILTFGRRVNPALVLGYAAAYGVTVGVVSHAYNSFYNGVVLQAVVGTALAFGATLTVYALRIVRVTPKFVRFVVAAGFALLGLMLLNLLVSLFHVGGIGLRENGPLGIAFSVVAILVGCFYLLLDFRSIEDGVRSGAPRKAAWLAAFGLTVSLLWIYLELLRFLSYFYDRD